jgi:L-seryl-tRNA(Ser) seleniumtransferase
MNDRRRALPSVNALLAEVHSAGVAGSVSRAAVVDAIRAALQEARLSGGGPPADGWIAVVSRRLSEATRPSLSRVINATGVVLHTNLGRAPMADAARDAVADALHYSTLEFDLTEGSRGSRQSHTRELLCDLTGAEDALVVNNAAAALMLVLSACADGGETIVSRGELVEIGGAFRIPEILARSGTVLIEVGTTNRTRLSDYALAISPRTRILLKVHRSNFQMTGFVSEATVEDLAVLGRDRGIPIVHDVGSGLLVSLERFGLRGEPLVTESVAAGATTVFSGDKLLGGPQAGIIVGPADVVGRIAQSPLARALRPDKITFAALEATLRLHRDPGRALSEIPTLAMLTADPADLKRRARRLARRIPGARTTAGASAVGGGAFPEAVLPTTLVVLETDRSDDVLAALRTANPPVIARTVSDRVVLDVRTIRDDEFAAVADAVRAIGWNGSPGR